MAIIEHGTWPNTIPDTAITLSGCFFTIPFQTACMIVAKRIIKKTCVSIWIDFKYIYNLNKASIIKPSYFNLKSVFELKL